MSRDTKFNPMDKQPPDCPCGAPAARGDADEAKKQARGQRCHICRDLAARNPGWSGGEVTAAGVRRWLELALAGVRALARGRPGEAVGDAVYPDRLEWTIREGYERLAIRGMEPGPVIAALGVVHPDLVIADRVTKGETVAVRLVRREEVRDAA
jgi:hypothetical protein